VCGASPAANACKRLGAADLTAVDGHRRVQRHVLRLERRDLDAAPLEDAAQRGDQRRLAGIGGSALNHQGVAYHRPNSKKGAIMSASTPRYESGKMGTSLKQQITDETRSTQFRLAH
jgi:hypothetical protein